MKTTVHTFDHTANPLGAMITTDIHQLNVVVTQHTYRYYYEPDNITMYGWTDVNNIAGNFYLVAIWRIKGSKVN